jgi:SAM-dependent methyltransferase
LRPVTNVLGRNEIPRKLGMTSQRRIYPDRRVVNDVFTSWQLACPNCRAALRTACDQAVCSGCEGHYPKTDGIWRCLAPDRADAFARFEHEYQTIRRAEGWGREDSEYYRALPWRDLSGRFPALWQIRARSFSELVKRAIPAGPVRILDLGSGCGWLSYRLAQQGHQVAAVDVLLDRLDGLGAHVHYDAPFTPVQAEFDRLPFSDRQIDVAVFNGSLHYTPDYDVSLHEALRVLRPDGRVAVVDTPMYSSEHNGKRMIEERYARFCQTYGFNSDSLGSEQFMTRERLDHLGRTLGVRWELIAPFHGLFWSLRPWLARLRGHREPAQFPLMIGSRI